MGSPSQLGADSCTVVILPAHQRSVFLFPCMFWSRTARGDSRVAPVSSSTSSSWPVCCLTCGFIYSVLLCGPLFFFNHSFLLLSFFLSFCLSLGGVVWIQESSSGPLSLHLCLNRSYHVSLFIQPALCFTLPCFIYGSHVLWLQLPGGFPKASSCSTKTFPQALGAYAFHNGLLFSQRTLWHVTVGKAHV